jgi:glyoxylase-like metal-dependent hydrolase (beta-lactamase superfamily II)
MPLQLGPMTVHPLVEGHLAIDGGTLFGAVPRALWGRRYAPDEHNRVGLVSRVMLIERGARRILVDAGIGSRWDGHHRALHGFEQGSRLDAALAHLGLARDAITDVVLTHLHFDVAGGLCREEGGELRLSFPKATVHLQRRHWKWAHQPSDKDQGSFREADFALLERSGQLHLLEGGTELCEGVTLFVSEGHTVGMQLVRLEHGDETLAFLGDLVPTTAHLHAPWVSALDLYPLTSIEEKKQVLAQAVEERWRVVFSRDPAVAACTVKDDGSGHVVVDEVLASS